MSEPMYKVNLLPPNLQREELIDMRRLLILAVSVTLTMLVLGAAIFFVVNYFDMRQEIASETSQLASLQPSVNYVQTLQGQTKMMQGIVTGYKVLLNRQVTWSSLLYELDDIAPTDLWLVELDLTNASQPKTGTATPAGKVPAASIAQNNTEPVPFPDTVTVKGMALSVPSVGIFVQNMRQLPYFKDVVIKTITAQTGGNSFEITAYVKDELHG
ncbi:MAG: PilN domain-containing protein [Thermacetogeniaceae bacterium]